MFSCVAHESFQAVFVYVVVFVKVTIQGFQYVII